MCCKTRIAALFFISFIALRCLGQSAAPTSGDQAQIDAARSSAKAEQDRLLALATANAEKLDKAADALVSEVRAAVAANASIKTYDALLLKLSSLAVGNRDRYNQNAKIEILRTFITRWQDYLYATEQSNFEVATQTLNQMIQEAAMLPIVPRSELMVLRDQQAGKIAEADKALVAPLLKRLEETFESADSSADFDPLLVDISAALTKESQAHPNRGNGAVRSMQEIRQFVSRWQEYLSLRDSGKSQDAQNVFRSLTTENSGGEIATQYRSKIRSKSVKPKAPVVETLRVEALTLETLDAFAAEVKAQEKLGDSVSHPRLSEAIGKLIIARNQIRSRNEMAALNYLQFTDPQNFLNETGIFAPAIDSIRQKLLNLALANRLKPSLPLPANENPKDFLNRIIQTQIAEKNYNAAYDALVLSDLLYGLSPNSKSSGAFVFQALVEGRNQEAAQQYALAVRSYLRALASTSSLVPIAEITATLNRIKIEHPQEYMEAQGSTIPASSPVKASVPMSNRPPGRRPGPVKNGNGRELSADWRMYYFSSLDVDPDDDPDWDGMSNRVEYDRGSDPTDYYNGAIPVITTLSGTNVATGEFAVKVTQPDGTPYVAAPVNFEVPATAAQIAGNPDSTILHQQILTRSDKNGIARVYLRPPAKN